MKKKFFLLQNLLSLITDKQSLITNKLSISISRFPGSPDFAVIVYYWKGEPIPFEPNFKQNGVRADKEFERYQRMEEVENQFVETAEPQPGEVVEEILDPHVQQQIVCEEIPHQ